MLNTLRLFATMLAALSLAPVMSFAALGAAPGAHPLEPLTAEELQLSADLIAHYKQFPQGALFPMIALREPPKSEVKAFAPGQPFRREAFATVLDRAAGKTYEVVVDLVGKQVKSFNLAPGVQPMVLVSEYDELPKIVKADARWQAAMKKRGISEADFDKVWVDAWATGSFVPKGLGGERQAGAAGVRILRGLSYWKNGVANFYGRPIEGVIAIVDMNHGKVLELIDTGVKPVPTFTQELDPASIGTQRKDLKALRVSTPDGPSYSVSGHEVRWQKWRFRFALHPREGLVLYQVAYDDDDNGQDRPRKDHPVTRSVLYRASLSETVVPYGDPDPNWSWRNAFDEGEYGMGRLMSSLEPKVDAPENAQFFDADFIDDFGKPYVLKNAVGLYERDGGYLWKHYDIYTQKNEARRARDLVLFSVAAIGNYDYVFSWIFHQDGSIDCDVGLTGIMLPKGVDDSSMVGASSHLGHHGHLVAQHVVAPHHQHFINYRLDFDVDGELNSVAEMNSRAMPAGPGNRDHNGILMELNQLASEKKAERDLNLEAARKWIVYNPAIKNALGYSPGYALIGGDNSVPYIGKESMVRKRGAFINHHFWATRFHEDEIYSAGYYPNQSRGGEGLEKWSGHDAYGDESLDAQDVVLWYTFGVTHIPRPEEWPVMAMAHAGFKLAPVAFFTRNPGLDVPR